MFANYQFPVVFTRATNVYGPGQQLYRIVPRTIVAAMGGERLRLDGGGKSIQRLYPHDRTSPRRDPQRIARTGKPGDTYHISGYELVSIRTLIEMILKRLGKSFDDCVEVGPERPGKDTAYTARRYPAARWSSPGATPRLPGNERIDDVIHWAEPGSMS